MSGMMNKYRYRKCSFIILLAFMLTMVFNPIPAYSQSTFPDVQGHWAQGTIEKMTEAGIISGNPDGSFKPDGQITRAEFATLVVKAFGYTGSGKVFNDTAQHWAKDYIAIASANGIVNGYSDTRFGPDDQITREQMAVMIVKAAQLQAVDTAPACKDAGKISSWARTAVATAYANGIIKGLPDGRFDPQGYATRAQAAIVIHGGLNISPEEPVVPDYSTITAPGTYGPAAGSESHDGNVTIKSKNVTLQNLVIQGDLIIAEEVGDGDVILNNVQVKGKTYVRGGGTDSIHINGGQYNEIIVEETATGQVRIVAVNTQGIKVTISENAEGEEIILNGDIKTVTVKADNVKISTQGDTTIGELNVPSGLKNVNIDLAAGSSVAEMKLESIINVDGEGKIDKASGSQASDSTFATPPATITKPTTGGGGGGSTTVAVSAIKVTPTTMTLYAGGATGTITATVEPSNATNKKVNWTTSDAKVATVANGVLTPVAKGTATITATSDANSSKKASCEVKVEEPIAANFVSTGNVGIAPDTAGDAAGKIYAEYKLVAGENDDAQAVSLAEDNVEYIKAKIGEGAWEDLTVNTDATLWFNVEAVTGLRTFEVKTKDEKVYTATLDWKEEIKIAKWEATNREGDHDGKTYVEYKLMDGTNPVSLKVGDVKLIASKDISGNWVALDPNTDPTLWFNKAKATGNYEFFVVTKDGVMYKATLDWWGGDVYDALIAVNAYLTSDKYNYSGAPEALESHLTTLGLQVGEGSDYAALDKTKTGGKNRKTAVFYDLNNNKPSEGYDLATLTTYFNDMVATRLVTEASMDLVNNAENIEALNGISFVTMLLERFQTVTYQTHSDIPVETKISTLQGLVDRYNALGEAGKTAVLTEIISIRDRKTDKKFARSQHTTDALATALTEIETEINSRLTITSVSIVDNKAYASTAAGEGNTVRVLGYGVGINLDAKSEEKKISDTSSIVIELYNGETLLGQQTFNEAGYTKHADKSATSGTIDAGGQYVATSWNNSWSANAKIDEIPDKAVATVKYKDGTATKEMTLNFTDTKIFEAAEAVYALFTNPFAEVETLELKEGATQENITAASGLVEAVGSGSSHKALFKEMITKANSLLNPGQGNGDGEENGRIGNRVVGNVCLSLPKLI